jgi:hypothetical protein
MNYVVLSSFLESASNFNSNIWGDVSSTDLKDPSFNSGSLCIYERYYYHGSDIDYIKETCYISSIKDKTIYANPVAGITYNGQGQLLKANYKKFGYTLVNKSGEWKQVVSIADNGDENFSDEVIPSEDTICERFYPLDGNLPPERIYVQSGKVIEGGNLYTPGDNFDTEHLPDWCLAQLSDKGVAS